MTDRCILKVSCLGFEQEYSYELLYGRCKILGFVERLVKLTLPTAEIIRSSETETWESKS